MRNFEFVITKQNLIKSQKSDFSNVTPGSVNYLQCVFKFDYDWNGFTKVANFQKESKKEYPVLIKDGRCLIPEEVTKDAGDFSIQVFGKKGDQKIVTNKVFIEQEGE